MGSLCISHLSIDRSTGPDTQEQIRASDSAGKVMNCSEFTRCSRVKRSGGEKEEERRRGSSISMHLNASRHA